MAKQNAVVLFAVITLLAILSAGVSEKAAQAALLRLSQLPGITELQEYRLRLLL